MDAGAAFFFTVLALQAVFTAAVVLLVGRRYPARIGVYRWVAPAAVPILLFGLVAYAFITNYLAYLDQTVRPFDVTKLAPLGPFAVAYGILWLIGVLFGGMLIRLVLRRR